MNNKIYCTKCKALLMNTNDTINIGERICENCVYEILDELEEDIDKHNHKESSFCSTCLSLIQRTYEIKREVVIKEIKDIFYMIEKLEIEIKKCSPWCWIRYISNKEKFICPKCLSLVKQAQTLRKQVRRMFLEVNND